MVHREAGGKTGVRGTTDDCSTPKMFMLAVQEIEGTVIGVSHPAQLLDDAFA
jgi:hypothetical protein